jgi:radical SAM protein with 4Fe4S-binding SPASM domain
MSVINAELVKNLYRRLLKREPENESVVAGHISAHATIDSLLSVFVNSPEYQALSKRHPISLDVVPDIEMLARNRNFFVEHPFAINNIELTNKCPFKCIMCARTNHMTRSEGFMEFELFKKAIDELVAANPKYVRQGEIIWFHHFGESLTHPDFDKFIHYAKHFDMKCGLSINPLLLTNKMAHKLLDSHLTEIYCSLDGHDNESFEKIRGVKDAYEISKKRMLDFLALKVKGGYRAKITLSMINFSFNNTTVEAARTFWESQIGIDEFLHKAFTTWDGNAEDVNALNPNVATAAVADLTKEVTCKIPWKTVTITWDGDVVPCCYDYDKRYVLGNLRYQTLTEIWNGNKMQALRKEFISNKVTNSLCKNCDSLRA